MAKDLLSRIEELRTKPEAVRNRYAFGIALTVTLCILVIWAVALPSRFLEEDAAPITAPKASDGLFASVGTSFENVKEWTAGVISTFKNPSYEEVLPVTESPFELDFEAMLASSTQQQRQKEDVVSTTTTASSSVEESESATSTPSLP